MKRRLSVVLLSGVLALVGAAGAGASTLENQPLSAGFQTGISGSVANCSILSVSNGSVAAYPSCAISCNSGYSVSGSSCAANAVSSGGGGGGGGGTLPPSQPASVTPTTVIYSPISSPAPILAPSTQTPTKKVVSINIDSLNVRGLPGTTGKVLGKVSKGAKFTILEENKGWYKVEFKKGVTGWVAASYVKTSLETLSLTAIPAKPSVTIVSSVPVSVRSLPSTKGKILGKVTNGSKFAIVETGSGWFKVEFKKGVTGWVSASYAIKK